MLIVPQATCFEVTAEPFPQLFPIELRQVGYQLTIPMLIRERLRDQQVQHYQDLIGLASFSMQEQP
jgi:hypothetical protein